MFWYLMYDCALDLFWGMVQGTVAVVDDFQRAVLDYSSEVYTVAYQSFHKALSYIIQNAKLRIERPFEAPLVSPNIKRQRLAQRLRRARSKSSHARNYVDSL
jgi:hypothetical protein